MDYQAKVASIKTWLGTGSINIFGKPFSGKDTQAKLINAVIDGNVIGGGDILRSQELPSRSREAILHGTLIPSDEYADIVLPFLSNEIFIGKPLVLSSVGRWKGEEITVCDALSQSGHQIKAVIHLSINNQDSIDRWQMRNQNNDRHNRHDDTLDILRIRLEEYRDKTEPVLDYYEQIGILIEIDGRKSREQVHDNILEALYRLSAQD
ncbi:hypothetical protein HGB24_02585 [Candidatus Saccharibacteria bacterium]|nr:hypothetical protein [Candidatus Saccharibacteria bacterium]